MKLRIDLFFWRKVLKWTLAAALVAFCPANGIPAGMTTAPRYTGRVLYRGTKTPVPGVLVEIVEAKDDGRPTDEVLGSTRAEADGRFTVVLEKPTDEKVTLAVSAVRTSADSGGDRRQEGYQIRTVRVPLGFLPFPSATKPNTVLIDRRKPGPPSRGEDN